MCQHQGNMLLWHIKRQRDEGTRNAHQAGAAQPVHIIYGRGIDAVALAKRLKLRKLSAVQRAHAIALYAPEEAQVVDKHPCGHASGNAAPYDERPFARVAAARLGRKGTQRAVLPGR